MTPCLLVELPRRVKAQDLGSSSISPVGIFVLSHCWLQRNHICDGGKISLCTWRQLEAFFPEGSSVAFSRLLLPALCVCEEEEQGDLGRWGGVMVDAEEWEPQRDGRTVAGLAARVGWVPPCLCALGTRAALGTLWTFQGNVGLKRGSWWVLGSS